MDSVVDDSHLSQTVQAQFQGSVPCLCPLFSFTPSCADLTRLLLPFWLVDPQVQLVGQRRTLGEHPQLAAFDPNLVIRLSLTHTRFLLSSLASSLSPSFSPHTGSILSVSPRRDRPSVAPHTSLALFSFPSFRCSRLLPFFLHFVCFHTFSLSLMNIGTHLLVCSLRNPLPGPGKSLTARSACSAARDLTSRTSRSRSTSALCSTATFPTPMSSSPLLSC